MKKIITYGIAATLCTLALSTQAFATDITEDMSIFAENPEELVSTIKGWSEDTFLDPNTIMPVYSANIDDYADTGKLKITNVNTSGNHGYISDLIDNSGNFLGVALITEINKGKLEAGQFFPEYAEDPSTHEKRKQCDSIDFRLYSEEIKSLMLDKGISTDVMEVKLLDLEGLGSVYYINNGTEEVLINMRGLSGSPYPGYFEKDDASDIIVLNEEFRQKAAHIAEERRKAYEDFKNFYGEDAYGAGGADGVGSANPNTGFDTEKHTAALTVELGIISVMVIGAAVVSKKRKNDH